MSNVDFIERVRQRAYDPKTRTDWAKDMPADLADPATDADISYAEHQLGTTLHQMHRALLTLIANGGFGPADGLIGVPGGRLDDDGRSIVELQRILFSGSSAATLASVVPLWDFGGGAWACVDVRSGHVLISDEHGTTDTGIPLARCMEEWADGKDVTTALFDFETRTGVNPFTRQVIVTPVRGRPKGQPWRG